MRAHKRTINKRLSRARDAVDAETLRSMRQSMNAESGFFEFELDEYAATAGATGSSAAEAEGANASMSGWLVPIRSQKYSERIEQKFYSWLLLAEETRDLRADDLSGAMLLTDAVDYENLVVTIRMSAHALTACIACASHP